MPPSPARRGWTEQQTYRSSRRICTATLSARIKLTGGGSSHYTNHLATYGQSKGENKGVTPAARFLINEVLLPVVYCFYLQLRIVTFRQDKTSEIAFDIPSAGMDVSPMSVDGRVLYIGIVVQKELNPMRCVIFPRTALQGLNPECCASSRKYIAYEGFT